MPWADDTEVLAVHRLDLREVQALGDCDHGRIDDAEGKAYVLLDEFRDARDVASSTSATWKPLPPNDLRKVTSACGPTRD
jgi:hypothetical protein